MKHNVRLGAVQETLLVPLYARAVESRRMHPILVDPHAAIPEGTVVEIGAGLNTRFERLDNGRLHWFDLDLPDVVELRRKFFADAAPRVTLSGSILDSDWIPLVRQSPGPYFFVAETVFVYLHPPEVKAALAQIARNFPAMRIALDTGGLKAMKSGNRDFVRRKMAARFAWACEDPRELEAWNIGLRLLESRTPFDVAGPLRARLSLPVRTSFCVLRTLFPKLAEVHRLNLFEAR